MLAFVGAALITMALLALAYRYFGEGTFDDRFLTLEYPVAIGMLVLGSLILWRSRRY